MRRRQVGTKYERKSESFVLPTYVTYSTIVPRWVTTTCVLDYSTVAIADKFGNISVVRLPQNTNDDVDEDPTGSKSLWDRGLLSGAGQKAECVTVFHVGECFIFLIRIVLLDT